MPRRDCHIVVLGAGGVGKSCLTSQFVQNLWIEAYDPNIEDNHRKLIDIEGWQCMLDILDTAGADQFPAKLEPYIRRGQGFLLVFSITNMNSLQKVQELRDEIVHIKQDPNVPLVLVGNKSDLEQDRVVSRAKAFCVAETWGLAPYYETSARIRANVDQVFIDLARRISPPHKRRHRCIIL